MSYNENFYLAKILQFWVSEIPRIQNESTSLKRNMTSTGYNFGV